MTSENSLDTNVSQQANATIENLKKLLREAESAMSNAGNEASEEYHNLRERVRDALAEGKTRLRQAGEVVRKQAARADEVIKENPYTAISVAAGIGLITGYLITRSCSRRD